MKNTNYEAVLFFLRSYVAGCFLAQIFSTFPSKYSLLFQCVQFSESEVENVFIWDAVRTRDGIKHWDGVLTLWPCCELLWKSGNFPSSTYRHFQHRISAVWASIVRVTWNKRKHLVLFKQGHLIFFLLNCMTRSVVLLQCSVFWKHVAKIAVRNVTNIR
jgi:hypothetical protein